MTRVKICGITQLEDALLAEKLGADALGFVFAPSPRKITPREAAHISKKLNPFTHRVGVFVNEDPARILKIVDTARLSIVQLHGDEGKAEIKALKKVPTIKAFQVQPDTDFTTIEKCPADFILLDAYSKHARGGLGETFNWDCIPKKIRPRIILAGGIGPQNVTDAIQSVHPYAIDASSLLETSPGIKSQHKLRLFFKSIKH